MSAYHQCWTPVRCNWVPSNFGVTIFRVTRFRQTRVRDQIGIWVQDQIGIWVRDQIRVGSETKSELAPRPNPTWLQDQIGFGSETKSDLGSRPNRIWIRDQIGFGSKTKSVWVQEQFGLGPSQKYQRLHGTYKEWLIPFGLHSKERVLDCCSQDRFPITTNQPKLMFALMSLTIWYLSSDPY